ncbi:MAG: hypothetical protein Q8862_12825 [Bacteroidota bacterium]|nr:hypothetical protein [Bacteroidota bacterium]MDP4205371.1 hypothetical protein [Bacteroidota bacterium]
MKKLLSLLLILFVFAGSFSCSQQKRLLKDLSGLSKEKVIQRLGEPQAIRPLDDGKEIMIYETRKNLPPANLQTGDNRLDPVLSPAFQRINKTIIYLDEKGKVFNVKKQTEYER